jgi:hypothetical protein
MQELLSIPLNLYDSNNYVLFVLNSLEKHDIYVRTSCGGVARPVGGWGRYRLVPEISEV